MHPPGVLEVPRRRSLVRSNDMAPPRLRRALRRVAQDRQRGARPLADEALRALATELRRWALARRDLPPSVARAVARELARTQPAMAVFSVWADDWSRAARGRGPRTGPLLRWVAARRHQLAAETPGVVRTVRAEIPPRASVLTISRSSTIRRALAALSPRSRPSAVRVLESRPGGEGRAMARELRQDGLNAAWVPDERAAEAVRLSDLVLLGADAVEPGGGLIHKVGTRRLAVLAKRHGVPVVVVAGRSKWRTAVGPRRLPPGFDRTAPRWISEYWTDAGRRRPPQRHEPAGRRTGARRVRRRGAGTVR